MSEELVKRLREVKDWWREPGRTAEQAADRIETLEAALREIDKRLNNPDSWLAQSIDARNIISTALAGEKKDG